MEAARLAASLPNPIKYSPAGNSRFVEKKSKSYLFYNAEKRDNQGRVYRAS